MFISFSVFDEIADGCVEISSIIDISVDTSSSASCTTEVDFTKLVG